MPTKRRIYDVTALAVGVVKRGGNRRTFAVKRSTQMPTKLEQLLEAEAEDIDSADFGQLSEDDDAVVRSAARLLRGSPASAKQAIAKLAGVEPTIVQAPMQSTEDPLATFVRADGSVDESKVPAQMLPFVRIAASEAQARKKIEHDLAVQRKERNVEKVRRDATTTFKHVAATDKLANLLYLAGEAGSELDRELRSVLTEAEGRIKAAGLVERRGVPPNLTGDEDSDDPIEEGPIGDLEKLIRAQEAKGKNRLEATEIVLRTDKGRRLYAAYDRGFRDSGKPPPSSDDEG